MRFDRMCNSCGHEFSVDAAPQAMAPGDCRCPACDSGDLIPIPVAQTEGYQEWVVPGLH
jgi:hypothetical protein